MAATTSRGATGRGAFLAGLDTAKRRLLRAVERWFSQRERGLGWHRGLGERLAALRPGDAEGRYGSGWLAALAGRLRCPVGLLYKCLAFHANYTAEQAAELERRGVRWKQVVLALGVPGRAQRSRLLLRAARKGWTWEELRLYLKQARPSRRPGSGRRPRQRAYEPTAGLEHLAQATQAWLACYQGTWAGGPAPLLEQLEGLDPGEDSAALLERLRRAAGLLREMAVFTRRLRTAVADLAARVEEVVTAGRQE